MPNSCFRRPSGHGSESPVDRCMARAYNQEFSPRKLNRQKRLKRKVLAMKLETVGVVGAGVMGVGVAHSLALADFRVRLVDLTEEKLSKARELIRQNIRLQTMMKRGSGVS